MLEDPNPYAEEPSRSAWQGGYDARTNHIGRNECPYDALSQPEMAAAWLAGWIAANMKDRFREDDDST